MTMPIKLRRFLKGLSRSLTAHAATLVMVVGYFQTQDKWLTNTFGPDATGDVLIGLGALMILLRAKTTESLAEKGAK